MKLHFTFIFIKKLFLSFFLALLCFPVFAQPAYVGTALQNGTYSEFALNDLGSFRQAQLAAFIGGSGREWNFIQSSGDFTINWRPYTSGQTLSGYNMVIDPGTQAASARYNSSTGGQPGLFPFVQAGYYYTINITEFAPPANQYMSILESNWCPDCRPITSVSGTGCIGASGYEVTVTLDFAPAANEYVYVRYSTDGFVTSSLVEVNFSGTTSGTATIPDQGAGVSVDYYVYSSNMTLAQIQSEVSTYGEFAHDMMTINLNNNGGSNYTVNSCTIVCPGNITLSSQAEVDAFNCNVITGDLTISGADITDLSVLFSLSTVGGNLSIQNNSALTNLYNLSSLTSVGGGLEIVYNDVLTNLDGLSSLSSVGGDFNIGDNSVLTNLDGLSSLSSVGGALNIGINSVLINLNGLTSLSLVGGDLNIAINSTLSNLNGLVSLSSVGGSVFIHQNSALANLDGLASLSMVGVTLYISDNPALGNLDGLSSLTSVGGDLTIQDNVALSEFCGLYPLLNGGGLTGSYTVTGNAVNPSPAQITVTGPCTSVICLGDVTLSTQAQVDAFTCTAITGSLAIEGADISDLTPLAVLTSIGGNLSIINSDALPNLDGLSGITIIPENLIIQSNDGALSNINGLSSLTSVGGDLSLAGNYILENVDGLSSLSSVGVDIWINNNAALGNLNGLSSLTSVGRNFGINSNATLGNLDGLSSLVSVGGNFGINNNPDLSNLDGLSSMTSVGELSVENNSSLTNLNGLSSLTSVEGFLGIQENSALSNLDGLSSLASVGGILFIGDNSVLTNLNGLSSLNSTVRGCWIYNNAVLTNLDGLSSLTSVGELVIYSNSTLTNLDGLSSLASVGGELGIASNIALTNLDGLSSLISVGSHLTILDNSSLTNLDGLSSLTSVGGNLTIQDNPPLTEFCGLYPLLNGGGLTGSYTVTGNTQNPTQQQIIDGGPCVECPVDNIIYVNDDASGSNNGTSWADAYTSLQDALTFFNSGECPDITQIWVAAGAYYPDEGDGYTDNNRTHSFVMKNNLAIYGGFAGNEDPLTFDLADRDVVANETILSGDIDQNDEPDFVNNEGNSYHIFANIDNGLDENAVLDGFTISGGNANGDFPDNVGGGMSNGATSPKVINCSFIGNSAEFGGGMYNYFGSTPSVVKCNFIGNTAEFNGGGISNDQSSSSIVDCSFSGNSADNGGGLYNGGSSPSVSNCSFSGNSATSGGGMYNTGNAILTNCSFSGNSAGSQSDGYGGGLYNSGNPTLTNCIFSGNYSDNSAGGMWNSAGNPALNNCSFSGNYAPHGGAIHYGISGGTITNSIFWGNSSEILGPFIISHSIVQGGWSGAGSNNIDADPLFVSQPDYTMAPTTSGDLRLQSCSPAINAGDNTAVPAGITTDLDGNSRFYDNGIVDMGAYEYQGDFMPCCANPSDGGTIANNQTICFGTTPNTLTSSSLPSGHKGTLEFKWQQSTTSALSGFSDIAASNSAGFSPGNLNVSTWYKRLARVECETDWTGAVESNVVQVDVNPLPIAIISNPIDNFEDGLPTGIDGGGNGIGFITWHDFWTGTTVAITTSSVPDTDPLALPGQSGDNYLLRFDANVNGWGGLTHAFENENVDTWVTQDWTNYEGITFWLYGQNTGNNLLFEVQDNRNPGSTVSDVEIWSHAFVDNFSGWRLFALNFDDDFIRKEIGNGAPNDGFGRDEVHGWSFGTLTTGGASVTYYLDNVMVYGNTGSVTICETGSHQMSGANAANGTILWSHNGGGVLSNETTLSPTYQASSADAGNEVTLTMTVTSDNACGTATATANYTINVAQLPVAIITGADGPFCPYTTIQFSAPAGMATYTWNITDNNGGGVGIGSWDDNRVFTPGPADGQDVQVGGLCGAEFTLTLTITDDQGCSASTQQTYTVEESDATWVNEPQDHIVACDVNDIETEVLNWLNSFEVSSNCFTENADYYLQLLQVNSPGNIQGGYYSKAALFGPSEFSITGNLEMADPALACDPLQNDLTGKIALIDRGSCTFVSKVKNAQDAGAIGVIVVNNVPGGRLVNMGGTDPTITIPSLFISYEDGQILKQAIQQELVNVTLNSFIGVEAGDYPVFFQTVSTCGQIIEKTVTLSITDTAPPSAVCQNITVFLDGAGNATITAADLDGGSTVNCGSVDLSASQTTFTCADIGPNNVTLTVSDGNGNESDCVSVVTVADTTSPNAVCQNINVYLDGTGNATITATDLDGGSSDNCGTVNLSASQTAFTCADIGASNVTLTVTDGNGNQSQCTSVVTIADTTAPNAVCQNLTVYLDAAGNAEITAADLDGGSADNCGPVNLLASKTGFTCADLWDNNVTLTVADGSGNSATCVAVVTVRDTIPATISCVAPPPSFNDPGQCGAWVSPPIPTTGDNCSVQSLTNDYTLLPNADAFYPVGITQVTWTVYDAANNWTTCYVDVVVIDNEPPTITCPADIEVTIDPALTGTVINYSTTFSDNCPGATLVCNPPSGSFFNNGTTVVTCTATDAKGNQSSCSFSVTVIPEIEIVYVDDDASGSNNGTSWDDAFTNLQDALALAETNPFVAQIWVAAGTYYPDQGDGYTDNNRDHSFIMQNNLAIYGGFEGTEDPLSFDLADRDFVTNETILSGDLLGDDGPDFVNYGDNSYHVILNNGLDNSAIIDGFTISGGNANGASPNNVGAGILNYNSSPQIANCILASNAASQGGGLYHYSPAALSLNNCSFIGNSALGFGGGIFSWSNLTFTDCMISENNAPNAGGIFIGNSVLEMTNCVVNDNATEFQGSGINVQDSPGSILINCLITGNTSQNSNGAIANFNYNGPTSILTIINSTVANNTSAEPYAAMWSAGNNPVTNLNNTIVANNIAGNFYADEGSTISDFVSQGNNLDSDGTSGFVDGVNGDIVGFDPLFVAADDFHLQPCSPAIDAGTNDGAPTADFDGNIRPYDPFGFGAVTDMGAYEFNEQVDYCTVCEAVAGTLTKTPNSDELCEDEDVSAALTPGSGGNGIDSLAYRTQNAGGTWSAWMEYNSGDPIATAGILGVEIQTVRKSDYCDYSDPETAIWTIYPTTVAGNISGATDIDYGSSTGDLVLSGNVGDVIKWQKRLGTDGTWTDIAHMDLTYSETPAALGTWQYRALVQSGVCDEEFTEPHSVLVGTKELTIGGTFTANDKIYDDNTDATFDQNNLELVGVVGTEDVSLTGLEIDFASKEVGNHTVSITNAELAGADKDNYTLTLVGAPTTTANINPGVPVKFLVTDPDGNNISSPKLANIPFDAKVTLVDAFDNPTPNTGGDVTITLTGSGGATPGDLRFQGFPADPVTQTLSADESTLAFNNILYTGVSDTQGMDVKIDAVASGTGSADGKTGESNMFSVREIFFTVGADPTTLPADGASKSDISVILLDFENNPIPDQEITVENDFGTLMEGTNELPALVTRTTDANGQVFLELRADDESAVATVTAKCPGACPHSVEVSFTLNAPEITGFTPGENQATVDFTPPTNPGTTTITNYEYSLNDGTDWNPFNPEQATSPVTVSGLTEYQTYPLKLRAINEAGSGAASNSFEIYACANPTDGGTIAADQNLFEGDTPALLTNEADASGEYGDLEYKWRKSTTSATDGFTDITGATDAAYQPEATFETTWFRRLAKVTCKADWSGATASNVLEIYVYQPPTLSIVTPIEGDNIYDYPLQVSGTAADPDNDLSGIYVRVNGGAWELATGTESWDIDFSLTFGSQKIEAKAVDTQNLESEVAEVNTFVGVQTITLNKGYSHISSFLDPLDADIENIMQYPVSQSLLTHMINSTGGIYWPIANINTIGNWLASTAYKVHLTAESMLIFKGDMIDERSIQFNAGATYLPVLSNVEIPIEDAFENPTQDVKVIFNLVSNGIYWPYGGIFTLSTLEPGQGYQAVFNNPVTVSFPDYEMDPNNTKSATPVYDKTGPWQVSQSGEVHLISLFQSAFTGLESGLYIGAFNTVGECIGFANISGKDQNVLLTVYGDDPVTVGKDGAESGELISFRSYNMEKGLETHLEPSYNESFPSHDGLYASGGLSSIVAFKEVAAGIGDHPMLSQIRIYPNPAKEELNLVFEGMDVSSGAHIELVNSVGSVVLTKDIRQKHTKLDIQHLQRGMYMLKIFLSGKYSFRKVIIQ